MIVVADTMPADERRKPACCDVSPVGAPERLLALGGSFSPLDVSSIAGSAGCCWMGVRRAVPPDILRAASEACSHMDEHFGPFPDGTCSFGFEAESLGGRLICRVTATRVDGGPLQTRIDEITAGGKTWKL